MTDKEIKGEEPYIACICKGISKNCVNPDSYGYICVRCNQCGRFDENKFKGTEIDTFKTSAKN